MDLKDESKPGTSSLKVKGELNGINATLYSRKDDDGMIYSVKMLNDNTLLADMFFKHSYTGANEGDSRAMIYFANYAVPKIQERVLAPFLMTGSTGEYKKD